MYRLLVAALLTTLPVAANAGPVPPCAGAPTPSFGEVDGPPQWRIWSADELRADGWQPAACIGWAGDTKLTGAVASRFRSGSDVFQRLLDVAAWPRIKYWSVSKQGWQPLAVSVSAFTTAGAQRLPVGSSLAAGQAYQFTERDENGGDIIYRLRILRHDQEHLVVTTENVTPIRIAIITAFEPSSLQTATFVQRIAADQWSTYQVTRVSAGANSLVLGHKGSFINRLEAVRRYIAGVVEDQQPPLVLR
jgi:hypothetical protein